MTEVTFTTQLKVESGSESASANRTHKHQLAKLIHSGTNKYLIAHELV